MKFGISVHPDCGQRALLLDSSLYRTEFKHYWFLRHEMRIIKGLQRNQTLFLQILKFQLWPHGSFFYCKVHPCSKSRDRLELLLLFARTTAVRTAHALSFVSISCCLLKLKWTLEGKQAFFNAPKIDLAYKLIIRYKNAFKFTGSCTNLVFKLSAFATNGWVLFYI